MANKNIRNNTTLRICFCGVLAALIFVANYFRIPFGGTQLHLTNGLCALAGLLFGPGLGFAAAGIGSGLYDIVAGYGAECFITLVNKGAIALVAGFIGMGLLRKDKLAAADVVRVVVACVVGALTYVALYMLKTYCFGMWVNHLGTAGTLAKMGTKLPGSLLNSAFASIIGPVLFVALKPALKSAGLLEKF